MVASKPLMSQASQFCLSRRSAVQGALGAGIATLIAKPARAAVDGLIVIGRDGWLYPYWEDVRSFDKKGFASASSVISQTIAAIKAAGIEVAVAMVPIKARVYQDFLPSEFTFSPDGASRYAAGLDVVRRAGAIAPDFAAMFAAARKAHPGTQYFFKTDTHWMPAGAELAAAEIAPQIAAKYNFPRSAITGVQFGDVMALRQGRNDLAEQLTPEQRSKFGPENYSARKELEKDGAGLTADDNPDVFVVGSSYTQPKYQFSQHISSKLNRPVGLFWKVHSYGPYRTLLDYLQSPLFSKAKRPKLLVWGLLEIDLEAPPDRSDFWEANVMNNNLFLESVRKAVA